MSDIPADIDLYTAAGVRELDRLAIEGEQIPGYDLMQRAAGFMFAQLQQRYPAASHRRWLLLCGAGNNAGDGYVLARLASQAGYKVKVVNLKATAALQADAQRAASDWLGGNTVQSWQDFDPAESYDLCIDALLGTGLDRPVGGDYLAAVNYLNQQSAPVAAVDVPTGLNADTGSVASEAVKATVCCSFIGRKQGLYTADGPDYCGDLLFDSLNVPDKVYSQCATSSKLLTSSPEPLPQRRQNSHKGSYGHILVCGGQAGMSGAVLLAGTAALRCGAGRVSIATASEHAANLNLGRPELMVTATEDQAAVAGLALGVDVLALGPGLGTSEWGQQYFSALLDAENTHQPMVLDADGLNILATRPVARGNWILTPHPAEAARLLEVSTAQVQADRFSAVRELARKYQAVVVLKGKGSLIAAVQLDNAQSTKVPVYVCPFGNPGMASAGMGDTLTGVLAALLAQGYSPLQAARLGVVVHARAGDCLAASEGPIGLLAADMPAAIRKLLND